MYILQWMIRSFDDNTCMRLLSYCYKALPDDRKVFVMNSAFPEVPVNSIPITIPLFELCMKL